jgi:hypothetical protein
VLALFAERMQSCLRSDAKVISELPSATTFAVTSNNPHDAADKLALSEIVAVPYRLNLSLDVSVLVQAFTEAGRDKLRFAPPALSSNRRSIRSG